MTRKKKASPKKKPARKNSKASKARSKKSDSESSRKSGRVNKKKPTKRIKLRPASKAASDTRQRLQRVMAAAGVGSRRECELIIEEGRVEVDGRIVTQLGVKVDPDKQEILVDAQKISVPKQSQYFMLNKPPGILSTSKDPSGRPRVIDLIKTSQRVYNVGRLDKASEGLILVTNDGELANRLTHPSFQIEKRYHVKVSGIPAPRELRKLEQGVRLAEGVAIASSVKFLKKAKNGCWLEIVLKEGRNREIRRMLALLGHKVRTLKRVAIGPLRLGNLPIGAHRPLTSRELKLLRQATDKNPTKRVRKSRSSKRKPAAIGKEIRLSRQKNKAAKPGTKRKKRRK